MDTEKRCDDIESRTKTLEDKVEQLAGIIEALRKQIRRLHAKTYPQIIAPVTGDDTIRRDVTFRVMVNSNKRVANTHEIVIVEEADTLTPIVGPVSVGFAGGNNPGVALFSAALMGTLTADTDYVVLCRRVGGASSNFVEHSVAIRTVP